MSTALPTSTARHAAARSDWGPARHDPEDPCSRRALQASLDHWDVDGPRPDDN